MPNPNTNFKLSDGRDLGSVGLTKEYLMTVYPQIANQLITPELWTWGLNNTGQLGVNDTTQIRCTPVTTFAGGANWKQVSMGQRHTAAIKTDGTLWTWGYNGNGQLGINDTGDRFTPVTTFAGGTNWKQVACGGTNTIAIKTDGTLWGWGYNMEGQLGINALGHRSTPVTTFAGGTDWKQVAAGRYHTAAIKTDGKLWTWGSNSNGQLGVNDTNTRCTPVTTFAGGTNWKQLACGQDHIAAVKTDGTLWTWGLNNFGQLGLNNATTPICTPVTTFAGGTNWKQVACNNYNTAAIKTDGTLWNWGFNSYGELGINNTNRRCTPVTTFAGGTNWKQVACGRGHIAAVKTDGTLWTWGFNQHGALGINDSGSTNRSTPVTTFAGGTNWKQVFSNMDAPHIAAIKTSDDLIGI
jgi:alpha-tubulin suppressor-like RCC1 family protein